MLYGDCGHSWVREWHALTGSHMPRVWIPCSQVVGPGEAGACLGLREAEQEGRKVCWACGVKEAPGTFQKNRRQREVQTLCPHPRLF